MKQVKELAIYFTERLTWFALGMIVGAFWALYENGFRLTDLTQVF